MTHLLQALPVLLLCLFFTGCGQVFVRGALNPDGSQAVSGTVSLVQLTVISGPDGTSVTVTAVTLIQGGMATDANFCGDQRTQFPLHRRVRANFVPGAGCSSLTFVVNL